MLALAIAAAVSIGVYLHLTHQLRFTQTRSRRAWRSWWRRNRALWLSLFAGGGTLTLMALGSSLWHESEAPWLAVVLLLQGAGLWVAVGTVIRCMKRSPNHLSEEALGAQQVYGLLSDLSHPQPLKRMIAVRLLTDHLCPSVKRQSAKMERLQPFKMPVEAVALGVTPGDLRQYFSLMLEQESHAQVRTALQDSLALLPSSPYCAPYPAQRLQRPRAHPATSTQPPVSVPSALGQGKNSIVIRRRVRSRPLSASTSTSKVACSQMVSGQS